MYSTQPHFEENVTDDTLPSRRGLHTVPSEQPALATTRRARRYQQQDVMTVGQAPTQSDRRPTHVGLELSATPLPKRTVPVSPPERPWVRTTNALELADLPTRSSIRQAQSSRQATTPASASPDGAHGPSTRRPVAPPDTELTVKRSHVPVGVPESTPVSPDSRSFKYRRSRTSSPSSPPAPLSLHSSAGSTQSAQSASSGAPSATSASTAIAHAFESVTPVIDASAKLATRRSQRMQEKESIPVFDIEEYGPLSPESADLRSGQADKPLELREPVLSELMWLQEMRYHLRTPNEPPLSVKQLSKIYDEYCAAWHAEEPNARWDQSFAVTSIGIAIGDILAESSVDRQWVVSETRDAKIFGVRDSAKRATYFPIDAVSRRWVAGKLEWIPGFVRNALSQSSLPDTQSPS